MKKLLLAGVMVLASIPFAQAGLVYENVNPGALYNCNDYGPCNDPYPYPNTFTLTNATFINTVEGYFVTSFMESGVSVVSLGLTNLGDNTTVSAVAADMGGFHPGFYQVATLNQWFAPGNYQVYASDVSRWGLNETSGFAGLSRVTDAVDPQVPEPATWGMIGLGLAALGFRARRRA